MRNIFFLAFLLSIFACDKADTDVTESKGKILFYSDVFVVANCEIDNVSIFIDNEYKGKLTSSYLPLDEIPSEEDMGVLVVELPVGNHSYSAKISGCNTNQWNGAVRSEERRVGREWR